MKKVKGLKQSHSSNQKMGQGDHLGIGMKNPVGKVKEVFGFTPLGKKAKKSAPKSLA
jgi:hypothetical protein